MLAPSDDVIHLKDLDYDDKKFVGEELSSLGEIAYHDVNFSPSFVITPHAFTDFKNENDLDLKINHMLGTMNPNSMGSVIQVSKLIINYINKSALPNSFVKKIFREYESIQKKTNKINLTLTAFYLHNGHILKKHELREIKGESSLLTSVRELWAYAYEHKLLKPKEVYDQDKHSFGVVILVKQEENTKISGYIRTIGDEHEKHHYVIEALENVKVTYNKNEKKFESGMHLKKDWHQFINIWDFKKLIDIAEKADKYLYYPHIIYWGKNKEIFVTNIKPVTHKIEYYSKLEKIKGIPLNPGIRIGRVRHISKNHEVIMSNEEVVIVKTLTKPLLESVKRASAIITEDNLNEELKHYLRQRGVPVLTNAKDASKSFRNGELVTVDATNGFIKHGSIFMS